LAKEAYYFSHDANARQDEKILMLRAEHGWEGYGIYWALIEMMFENGDTALSHDKIKGLAISYNIDITMLQSVINTCIAERLFASDDDKFWSESLKRRKEKYQENKAKKSSAGKKGMEKRWGKHNSVITENNKGKESKVNKDIYIAHFNTFWELYPSKKGKVKAQDKFISYGDSIDIEKVLEGTRKYIAYCEAKDRPFKDGSTFVNNRSWDDDWSLTTNVSQFPMDKQRQFIEAQKAARDKEYEPREKPSYGVNP
jgi:hypothetical protein